MDFVLSKIQKALASIVSFFMVDSTGTATCLLPQRDYPYMPQANGSLEISPIWQVLDCYQVHLPFSGMHMIKHLGYLLFSFLTVSSHNVINVMDGHNVLRNIKGSKSLQTLTKGQRDDLSWGKAVKVCCYTWARATTDYLGR